jgi:hypothetical protein
MYDVCMYIKWSSIQHKRERRKKWGQPILVDNGICGSCVKLHTRLLRIFKIQPTWKYIEWKTGDVFIDIWFNCCHFAELIWIQCLNSSGNKQTNACNLENQTKRKKEWWDFYWVLFYLLLQMLHCRVSFTYVNGQVWSSFMSFFCNTVFCQFTFI